MKVTLSIELYRNERKVLEKLKNTSKNGKIGVSKMTQCDMISKMRKKQNVAHVVERRIIV